MAFDKSSSAKKPAPKKPAPGQQGAPPPGGGDPMNTGAGVQPPMPGSGMDPYAALSGMISNIAPQGMPMSGDALGGPGDNINGLMGQGGGFGSGMGQGVNPSLQPGPPVDPIQHALMSQAEPMAFPPDIGQTWADPSEDMQGNMSVDQLLTMLTMLQGGIPSSGMDLSPRRGSTALGAVPAGMMGGI